MPIFWDALFKRNDVLALSAASEYYGVAIGRLKNTTFGISAEAWLVNATAIQLTNLDIAPNDGRYASSKGRVSPGPVVEGV